MFSHLNMAGDASQANRQMCVRARVCTLGDIGSTSAGEIYCIVIWLPDHLNCVVRTTYLVSP